MKLSPFSYQLSTIKVVPANAPHSLPPYDILDAILRMYVEEGKSAEEIAAKGFDAATVSDVIGKVSRAEYKRSQYPIGPKLSTSAFSTDRIIPVSAKKGMF